MKKNYAFLLTFLVIIGFSVVILSCSKDDEYTPIADDKPVATDDFTSYLLAETVEIPVLDNDTTGDEVLPTTVSLIGGIDTDSNGTLDEVVVSGQGTWKVNSSTGVVTFIPEPTFQLEPTPIKYTVQDAQENVSNQATITITAEQSVVMDLTQVPFPKLSDYKFFAGELKNQIPSLGVLPYEPASSLFTDYAHKKRFVWMPSGTKATYEGDGKSLELPVGAAIIKNFYYDNVIPGNVTRIIESRIMIRKADGWIFAEYVWNAEQTEAFLDLGGSNTSVTWMDESGEVKSTNAYRIPSEAQCMICHKSEEKPVPIGIKPQNLNFNYSYVTGSSNQLSKWIQEGYLENNIPSNIVATVDYNDTSKSLDLRVRSYVDINCAHCHQANSHCDYRPMRFAFSETVDPANMGVCVDTQDMAGFPSAFSKIVTPGNHNRSMLYHRITTNDIASMMPLIGRSMVHEEGAALIKEWINSLSGPCQ
jgi:uncharacterized repeat protein (TIGR03806 family)